MVFVTENAHFYSFFSIGMTILLALYYKHINGKRFKAWKTQHYLIFSTVLLLASIITDQIGMALGYWIYPQYTSVFSEVVKYVLEWVVAHAYILLAFFILEKKWQDKEYGKAAAFLVSGFLIGIITEGLNVFVYSWQVLAMPFSNAQTGPFFLVFQTIGYWLMVALVWICYAITDYSLKSK
jgi:hypothetical protein